MDVILVKDVKALGRAGDVVKVSDGQARNQLLPSGAAVPASADALRRLKEKKEAEVRRAKNAESGAAMTARRLNGHKLTLKEKTTEAGHLYAAITARTLAVALSRAGFDVSEDALAGFKPVKKLGSTAIRARLAPKIETSFTLIVEPSS